MGAAEPLARVQHQPLSFLAADAASTLLEFGEALARLSGTFAG
jgi:hypothetical protein